MVHRSMVHPTTSPVVTNSPRDTPGLWHRTCALYVTGPGLRDRPQLRDGAYDTDLQFVTGPGLRDRPVTVSCATAPSDLMLGSSDSQDPNVSRRSCWCQTILLDRATSDNKGRSGGKTFRLLSDASSGICLFGFLASHKEAPKTTIFGASLAAPVAQLDQRKIYAVFSCF